MKKGFTVLELLVVVGIFAVLATIVVIFVGDAREKAFTSQVVAQIREVNTATALYITHTGTLPPNCGLSCTALTDPYLTAPAGVQKWDGPYLQNGVWNLAHPWGGHFSVETSDVNGDGIPETYFFLDEDAPGTHHGNNSGRIPTDALLKIDALIDDGNLATGRARGDGLGFTTAKGEIVILFTP